MNIRRSRKNWNRIGEKDPWRGSLLVSGKRDTWDPEEFFETGRHLVERIMVWMDHNLINVHRGYALDFGCGPGRIAQALTEHFRHVVGVDVAPSMIEIADQLNPLADECEFVLNTKPNLRQFEDESLDFICSFFTFQHMEPRYMRAYLREFARILSPGGAIAVQIPDRPIGGWNRHFRRLLSTPFLQPILNVLRRVRNRLPGTIEMYGMRRELVEKVLRRSGLHLVRVSKCSSGDSGWGSYQYLAVRQSTQAETGETLGGVTVDDVESLVDAPDQSVNA